MNTYGTERLFPNTAIYENNLDAIRVPQTANENIAATVKKIETKELGETDTEKAQAQQIITNWAITLWQSMQFLLKSQNFPKEQNEQFEQEYLDKLLEFILHPDHGIVHSYFVYKGILHLAKLDAKPIAPGSVEDQEAQLFALFHDVMQTLPFAIKKNTKKGKFATINQKNEHARIMAVLTRRFGTKLGFDQKVVRNFAFGVQEHDSSYDKKMYPEKLGYIQMLGHDADKIYGASIKTDADTITKAMLERNYEANRGEKGSYLLRTEKTKADREKFRYGDRWFLDCIAVIIRELTIEMYTQAGKEVAQLRRESAIDQIHIVYGNFFDLTNSVITQELYPSSEHLPDFLELSITGADQLTQPLSIPTRPEDLCAVIDFLYNKPLILEPKNHRPGYNPETDARGWKISIKTRNTDNLIKERFLDPSIARFCFIADGRELFLTAITEAFQQHFTNGLSLIKKSDIK